MFKCLAPQFCFSFSVPKPARLGWLIPSRWMTPSFSLPCIVLGPVYSGNTICEMGPANQPSLWNCPAINLCLRWISFWQENIPDGWIISWLQVEQYSTVGKSEMLELSMWQSLLGCTASCFSSGNRGSQGPHNLVLCHLSPSNTSWVTLGCMLGLCLCSVVVGL